MVCSTLLIFQDMKMDFHDLMDFQDLKMDSEHLDIASEYQTSNLKVREYPNSKGLLMKKSQKVSAPHNLELQSTQSPSPVT